MCFVSPHNCFTKWMKCKAYFYKCFGQLPLEVGEVGRFSLWHRHGNCELTSEIPIQVRWFLHAAKKKEEKKKEKNLYLLKIKSRGKILQIKSVFIVHHYTKHKKMEKKIIIFDSWAQEAAFSMKMQQYIMHYCKLTSQPNLECVVFG